MNKSILNEVDRINILMGNRQLISEQVGLLFQLVKSAGKWGDEAVEWVSKGFDDVLGSKVQKMVDNGEILQKEADDLMKILKNKSDDALKYLKQGGDDLDTYIKKITSEPKVQKIIKKVTVKVTDAEMAVLRKYVVDNWSGFDDWYKVFKDKGFIFLEKGENKFVTKDKYIQNFGKNDTTNAFKDWPEVIERMKKTAETDPEIDEFFKKRAPKTVSDDASETIIKVADEAAEGKKPFTTKMEMPNGKIIDVPEGTYYVKTLDDAGEEVLIQKSLNDFTEIPEGKIKLSDYADEGVKTTKKPNIYIQSTEMSRLSKLYWNVVEPTLRRFMTTAKFYIDDWITKKTSADYFKKFEDAFKSGFRNYKGGGNFDGANKAYLRRVVERFQTIARNNPDIEGVTYQDIYRKLWDDYVEEGRKFFDGDSVNLRKFNEYVTEVENFKSSSGRNLSMSEIFGKTAKSVDDEVSKAVETTKTVVEKSAPAIVSKVYNGLVENVQRILSLYFTGFLRTPADFSRALLKGSKKTKLKTLDAEAFGTEAATRYTIQRKTSAFWETMYTIGLSYIVFPAVLATIEAGMNGWAVSATKIQAEGTKGYEPGWDAYINGYIINRIVNGYDFDLSLLNVLYEWAGLDKREGDNPSWGDVFGKYPGSLDNNILNTAEFIVMGTLNLAGYEFESAKEKIETIGKEKGIIVRENLPQQVGAYSEDAEFFRKYLVTPVLRKRVVDKNIDYKRAAYTVNFVRSDSKSIWVEDPSLEKKYNIVKNEKAATDPKYAAFYWDDNGTQKSILDLTKVVARKLIENEKVEKEKENNKKQKAVQDIIKLVEESIYKKRIMENNGKKFGVDNFKHWNDTFTFYNFDNKSGEYKEVKITSKMDVIMNKIDHYRKTNDEDDAFVRAVIHTFKDKIDRVSFDKGMAHLTESVKVFGLMKVLSNIRESKELEIWTVKHYSDGNWELVKGSFNKKELQNVGKTVKDREKEQEERKKPVDGLKKKEQEAIISLKNDESSGLENLPIKVKEKVKEKLSKGWTTETPMEVFDKFYDKSEINSVFNEKIEIYKLDPTKEFLQFLVNYSSRVVLKKGFCKSLKGIKNEVEMNDRQKQVLSHFITKCNNKFNTLTKKYKPSYND